MTISAKYVHTNLVARDWKALAGFYEKLFGCLPVPPERDLQGEKLEAGTGLPGAHLRVGKAKPYQVKQLLGLVERYNLSIGETEDYHIIIFFSDEDKGYIADIPDLPHCAAFGETQEQALAEVLKAKAAWLEAARAENKPIPEPSFLPVIYQTSKIPA